MVEATNSLEPEFDPYCLEVGRLTAFWASFERSLDALIWEMMDIHAHHGMCLTGQMIGPGPRVRAICALAGTMNLSTSLIKDFGKLAERAEKLGAKRNRYVHDNVVVGIKSRIVRRVEITANKKMRYVKVDVEIYDIVALRNDIQLAIGELESLKQRFIVERPDWSRSRYLASVAPFA